MKQIWSREDDSLALVVTPHEVVILEMALRNRVTFVGRMLGHCTHPAIKADMNAELQDIMIMLDVLKVTLK